MTRDGDGPRSPNEEPRRRKVLDAALLVFARFGFRKASMDEVARAAGVSRQGLYLHFATKEELFKASVEHALGGQLHAAVAALADEARPIEARLVSALDEWLGRYVGVMGADASDLIETSGELSASMMSEHAERFERAVANAIAESALKGVYAGAGVSPKQLARTLHATARGFKHESGSRDAFVEDVATAVRVLCAPLGASTRRETPSASKPATRRAGR
jgi:AcrR family transcriptional regulator